MTTKFCRFNDFLFFPFNKNKNSFVIFISLKHLKKSVYSKVIEFTLHLVQIGLVAEGGGRFQARN